MEIRWKKFSKKVDDEEKNIRQVARVAGLYMTNDKQFINSKNEEFNIQTG